MLHLRLNRPDKRNSVHDALLAQLHSAFVNLPADVRVVVISAAGEHFCAGLDLGEVSERNVVQGIHHSRAWHAAFETIQYGPVPVLSVLHGAVVGGGLEAGARFPAQARGQGGEIVMQGPRATIPTLEQD
ncbi:enoyl-CoA hydratase-related protein [Thiomonas sp. FB-6]|uniref:enoyl-CoA hydratase-related protein n=1 Tax=Thiomonas sp. FB-6 TaxID=1158291 RepID=UPI0003A18E27